MNQPIPRTLTIWVTIVLVTLGSIVTGAAAREAGAAARTMAQFPDPARFEPGSREWLKASEALRYRPLVDDRLTDNCPHSFDVQNYNITMSIDFDNLAIYGDTRVTATSEVADLSSINLDLTVLAVDAVLAGAESLAYAYADPVLTIDLGRSYAAGDTFEVRVIYHGRPGNEGAGGFGGFWFDGAPLMAFQMGVGLRADPPSMGKYWFPCWDWPCDKATADFAITVAGTGKKVVANGALVSVDVDSVANTTTFVWSETHQIAPHVMMVSARRYTELVDSTYDWIHYWVYPPVEADARVHFQNVDVMMDAFISRYGPYPFSKFGYAMATKGDMEHQTCVTHSAQTVRPDHAYDWLLAHEMGHQWWGDCISVNDWRDVWLSEGFATYSEAVFWEYAYGAAAYRDYMQASLMTPVLASPENFPIYDPNYLWGTTVYEKGGCVLHMLRGVVGDSAFFDALAAYRQAHEYGSAVTTEFQAAVETVSAQDLDWFFNEWIYDVGWPEYEYSWRALDQGGQWALNLVIDQAQTNGPIFTMPVEVRITGDALDTLLTFWVDEAHEAFDVMLPQEPTALVLDPSNWILNRAEEVAYAGAGGDRPAPELRLEQNVPNPFAGSTRIAYSVPRAQHVRLDVYDAAGRKVAGLVDRDVARGRGDVAWKGEDGSGRPVAPGTYFCRLVTPDGARLVRMTLVR